MVILYQILYKGFNVLSDLLSSLAAGNFEMFCGFGRRKCYFNVIDCKIQKGNLYLLIHDDVLIHPCCLKFL